MGEPSPHAGVPPAADSPGITAEFAARADSPADKPSRRGSAGRPSENLLNVMDDQLRANNQTGYEHQRALFCLAPDNRVRLLAIRAVKSPWFGYLTMLVIMGNCIQIASVDPLQDTSTPEYEAFTALMLQVDLTIVVLFTAELLLKVVAMGFVLHKNAYLRDRWNWVDIVVVILGWVDVGSQLAGTSSEISVIRALRVLRVLRPLRSLTFVPFLSEMITCLLGTVAQLGAAVGVLLFFLVIFGLLGVQLFSGMLRHQCWGPLPAGAAGWASTGDVCNPWGDPRTNPCDPGFECRCGQSGLPAFATPGGSPYSACLASDNPNHGLSSFDDFWRASLTVFQCITLEGWTDIMYAAQDGVDAYAGVYFVLAILFGAYLVVQLFLAVLSDAFNTESEKSAPQDAKGGSYVDRDGDGIMDLDMAGKPALQVACYRLVSHVAFRYAIHGAILTNTALLCATYYGQPAAEEQALTAVNYVLTGIFTFEIVAKVIAMGGANSMRDAFNRFDVFVVSCSLLEIGLDLAGSSVVNLSVLRSVRMLRLLRIFKLMRSMQGLMRLVRALLSSLNSVSSLALLLLIVILVYALIGIQIFGGIYTAPPHGRNANYPLDTKPQANFDTFAMACISIFIVISSENWNQVYDDTAYGLQTTYGSSAYSEIATIYFYSLFVIGVYVVFNIFVAIILVNITRDSASTLAEAERAAKANGPGKIVFAFGSLVHVQDEHAQRIQDGAGSRAVLAELSTMPLVGWHSACDYPSSQPATKGLRAISSRLSLFPRIARKSRASCSGTPGATSTGDPAACGGEQSHAFPPRSPRPMATVAGSLEHSGPCTPRTMAVATSSSRTPRASRPSMPTSVGKEDRALSPPTGTDRSFGLFAHTHPLRRWCWRVMLSKQFEQVLLVLIVASSISLAFDTPVQSQLTTEALRVLNWIFTLTFGLEMLLKMVALGVLWPAPTAYLRSNPNVLDLVIVASSVALLALDELSGTDVTQYKWVKALRLVRILRPLRMTNRLPGLKKVVDSLFMALPQCANVAGLMLSFVFIWAVVGVQLFKGKWHACSDGSAPSMAECLARGERWVNPDVGNFDHVGYGTLLLLEMVSLEGWPDRMFAGMYCVDVDLPPLRDDRSSRVAYALFFITWVFFGAFIVWNMFVAVMLDTFSQLRKQADGTAFMSAEQRAWMEAQRTVYAMRPLRQFSYPSTNPLRRRLFDLVHTPMFERAVVGVIVCNTAHMMLQWHDQPAEYSAALRALGISFSLAFLGEMVVKLFALGVRQYVTNGWNAFDGAVVLLSLIDLLIESASSAQIPISPNMLRLLALFRVLRLLRIVKSAKGLRTLLVTLWSSLPALQNVGLLLALCVYIYAVAGMYLFSGIKYGDYLTRHANFDGFWISLLTLVRCQTGENWNGIMHDCMGPDWADNAANCADPASGSCGSTGPAVVFFLSFWLFGQAILLNLVIGVILENFSAIGSDNKAITVDQLEEFCEVWLKFDPEGTFVAKSYCLLPMLRQLSFPLGISGKKPATSRAQLLKLLRRIDIPDHHGEILFLETMTGIANGLIGVPLPLCDETLRLSRDAAKVAASRNATAKLDADAPAEHGVMTSYLVSLLQHRYRNYASSRNNNSGHMRQRKHELDEDDAASLGADDEEDAKVVTSTSTAKVKFSSPFSARRVAVAKASSQVVPSD